MEISYNERQHQMLVQQIKSQEMGKTVKILVAAVCVAFIFGIILFFCSFFMPFLRSLAVNGLEANNGDASVTASFFAELFRIPNLLAFIFLIVMLFMMLICPVQLLSEFLLTPIIISRALEDRQYSVERTICRKLIVEKSTTEEGSTIYRRYVFLDGYKKRIPMEDKNAIGVSEGTECDIIRFYTGSGRVIRPGFGRFKGLVIKAII